MVMRIAITDVPLSQLVASIVLLALMVTFTMWLAGGGIKPGITIGQTDDVGYNIAEDPISVYDLQATILHLMGLDHTKLTYRHAGRDYRLTDVSGKVVKEILKG